MNYLRYNKISLLKAQWLAEKNANYFFLLGASESLTRREDIKQAIAKNLPGNRPLRLYPKTHLIFVVEKNPSFAPCLLVFSKTIGSNNSMKYPQPSEKNPFLAGLELVPINHTPTFPIALAVSVQKQYCKELAFTAVYGIISLDIF